MVPIGLMVGHAHAYNNRARVRHRYRDVAPRRPRLCHVRRP